MKFIMKFIRKYWAGFCACSCEKCWNAPVGKEDEHCLNENTECKYKWVDVN